MTWTCRWDGLRLRPGRQLGRAQGHDVHHRLLGTDDFPRLRIGIGRPGNGDTVDFVLGSSKRGRRDHDGPRVLDRAVAAISVFLTEGIEAAMNQFNGV